MIDHNTLQAVSADIAFLTETLKSDYERLLMLRASLESALFKLGHEPDTIEAGLTAFYQSKRTVH